MGEFFHHYMELMSDPAHLAVEVSLMLIIDGLFLGLIWPLVKSRLNKVVDARVTAEHHVIDAEHGVVHPTTTGAMPAPVPARAPSFDEAWREGTGEAPPPRAAFDPDDDPGGYR